MTGVFTCLDQDDWVEIPDRHVRKSGNSYVGKDFHENHEIKVFVRKIEKS